MSIFCRHPTEFQKVWPDIVKEQWFKTDAYVVSYPTCTKNIEWYLTEMFHFHMIFHALFRSKNLVTLVTGKLFRFRFLIVMNKGFMSDQIIHSVPRAFDYCATDITDAVANLMLWSGHFLQTEYALSKAL